LAGSQIIRDFLDALESVESVTNARLYPEGQVEPYWHGAEVTHTSGENRIIPIFPNSWIGFDIYLPERVQRQIGDDRFCGTEHFHIDMYFAYHMPVTYISYEVPEGSGADPSSSVVIIRRFLEQKLPSSGEIISNCVGPSPFHADFVVIEDPSHAVAPKIEILTDDPGGYSMYAVTVASLKDGIPNAFGRLNDLFSSFYELCVRRSKILRRSTRVLNLAEKLLNPPEEKGFVKRARRSLSEGQLIAQINREVTLGRLDHLWKEEFLLEASRYNTLGEGTPLSKHFQQFRESKDADVWTDIEKLTKFSEERRQKLFANASVVISAVLGGIIGAILASTLTYFLTRASVAVPATPVATTKTIAGQLSSPERLKATDKNSKAQ
jgi:hypothetical protein